MESKTGQEDLKLDLYEDLGKPLRDSGDEVLTPASSSVATPVHDIRQFMEFFRMYPQNTPHFAPHPHAEHYGSAPPSIMPPHQFPIVRPPAALVAHFASAPPPLQNVEYFASAHPHQYPSQDTPYRAPATPQDTLHGAPAHIHPQRLSNVPTAQPVVEYAPFPSTTPVQTDRHMPKGAAPPRSRERLRTDSSSFSASSSSLSYNEGAHQDEKQKRSRSRSRSRHRHQRRHSHDRSDNRRRSRSRSKSRSPRRSPKRDHSRSRPPRKRIFEIQPSLTYDIEQRVLGYFTSNDITEINKHYAGKTIGIRGDVTVIFRENGRAMTRIYLYKVVLALSRYRHDHEINLRWDKDLVLPWAVLQIVTTLKAFSTTELFLQKVHQTLNYFWVRHEDAIVAHIMRQVVRTIANPSTKFRHTFVDMINANYIDGDYTSDFVRAIFELLYWCENPDAMNPVYEHTRFSHIILHLPTTDLKMRRASPDVRSLHTHYYVAYVADLKARHTSNEDAFKEYMRDVARSYRTAMVTCPPYN